MVTDNKKKLDKVYTAENHEELMETYKDWAVCYDEDTVGSFGYVAHITTAQALARAMGDKEGTVLDAGCGTGLVAEALKELGYHRLDGLDYSREMLEEARRKGLYRNHIHADMSKPLEIKENTYDAVVCSGTFTYGHVAALAFDELIRITKPGGIICFTVRDGAYQECGYCERIIELEQRNAWEQREVREEDYLRNEGVSCKLCVYEVC